MSFRDYLPSKLFQKRLLAIVGIIAVVAAVILLGRLIQKGVANYRLNKQIRQLPAELRDQVDVLTVGELQRKDSNGNGIADWEERLYGLDPLANGEENRKKVEEKRQTLRASAEGSGENAPTGETDLFTREFLSLVTSLQTSGALSEEALSNIAASVGAKFIPEDQKEIYSQYAFRRVRDSKLADDDYIRQSTAALEKSGVLPLIGYEMDYISQSLQTNNAVLVAPLDNFAGAYKKFAETLVAIPVPERLLEDHKALVNSAAYISESLLMIQKIKTDPMTAVQGLGIYSLNYRIMNEALDDLAAKLSL